jgi:hypothetical protein
MDNDALTEAIIRLCDERNVAWQRNVKVGPYMAPIVIYAYDIVGIQRDVCIIVEPRYWNPVVAQRMSGFTEFYMNRLRKLTDADFVAVVIQGENEAPNGLTSLSELGAFLDGFAPPKSHSGSLCKPKAFRGSPIATHSYETEIAGRVCSWTGEGIVFCAMPFGDKFDPVFFNLICPAVTQAELTILRTDQETTLQAIDRRIQEGIRRADIMIADITGHNPNVMYEIGVAHALGKQTLLIRHDNLVIPFDIRYHEFMDYSMDQAEDCSLRLAKRLRDAVHALWNTQL